MRHIIYFLTLVLALGCSPLVQQPDVQLPTEYKFSVNNNIYNCPRDIEWWRELNNPHIDTIIMLALRNNRDLCSAVSRVEAARNYISTANSEFIPSVGLLVEAEGDRTNGYTTKEYSVAPTIKWELSLFGERRNSRWGAQSDYLAQEWGVRATILSLTTEVAKTLYTLAQYEQSYTLALRSLKLRRQATALIDSMHYYGMRDGIALEQARSLVYSAQSEVTKYQRAVESTRLALNTLLGITSADSYHLPSYHDLLDGKLPPEIAAGLPSELLERRPDIMESYYNMYSAAAKVGVARAARFPSISLTAEGGLITSTLKDLSNAKPLGWSLLGSVTQPLFNFGALKRRERITQSNYAAQLYQYEDCVISAFNDVERALLTISTLRSELSANRSLVSANNKIAHTTNSIYMSGMGDYLSVVDAERELYASQIEYINLLAQQYISHLELIKALGGGF